MVTQHPDLTISVIIPVRNSQEALGLCLSALKSSRIPPCEVIVVDDSSTDNSVQVARSFSSSVVQLSEHSNPNHCRNIGAQHASGDILLFLDSDVIVFHDTLPNIINAFERSKTDAVVGVYSIQHRYAEMASQYKNLWIRHSYLKSGPKLDWLFGAVAAVKRDAFQRSGGFNRDFFFNKGGDVELGKRMVESKFTISLDAKVEVEHVRRHTLSSLLSNDLERSEGFVDLALKLGQIRRAVRKGFANIYPTFVYGSALAVLLLISTIITTATGTGWILPAILGALWLILNGSFLSYVVRHKGFLLTIPATAILFLDQLTCALGSLKGLFRWTLHR